MRSTMSLFVVAKMFNTFSKQTAENSAGLPILDVISPFSWRLLKLR